MANSDLKWFYNSKEWKQARLQKLAEVSYRCEECSKIAEEVHHKVAVKITNFHDINITINRSNLIALCKDCHNKVHNRFVKSQAKFDKNGNLKHY